MNPHEFLQMICERLQHPTMDMVRAANRCMREEALKASHIDEGQIEYEERIARAGIEAALRVLFMP